MIYNLKSKNFIVTYKCELCKKYHDFNVAGSDIVYEKNCLETQYSIRLKTDNRIFLRRRQKIAASILQYARDLRNNH